VTWPSLSGSRHRLEPPESLRSSHAV
jgi:hypothetical protein